MGDYAIFHAMFEHATIGILVADAKGVIKMANPFSEEVFGYENGELNGKQIEDLLPEELRSFHKKHREAYRNKPKQRKMGGNLELVGRRKDGSLFPVEISLGHITNNGEFLATAFINDVTHKKEVTQELRRNNKLMDEV